MKKNILTTTQNKDAVISKNRAILNIASKILASDSLIYRKVIEEWILEVWRWADENGLNDNLIPRDKNRLLDLSKIELSYLKSDSFIRELCFLENVKTLNIFQSNIKELPKEIINFKDLTLLNLKNNQFTLTQSQHIWIQQLREKGCSIYVDFELVKRESRDVNVYDAKKPLVENQNTNIETSIHKNITTTKNKDISLNNRANISDDPNRVIKFEDKIDAWIDKDTGLMWEVKTEENIEHRYVWSYDYAETANYPKELTDDIKDTFSYAKKLNIQKYCGFSDWRVPTKKELETILTKETINYYCIKSPLSENTSYSYWSSIRHDGYLDGAWCVAFRKGNALYYDGRSKSYFVRCVRGR